MVITIILTTVNFQIYIFKTNIAFRNQTQNTWNFKTAKSYFYKKNSLSLFYKLDIARGFAAVII